MRAEFPEYYTPSDDDLKRFVTDAIVILDTNVLLALYEFSVDQRAEVVAALQQVRERLWIPYQVGLEYQRNRMGVVRRISNRHEQLRNLPGARDLDGMKAELARLNLEKSVADEVELLLEPVAERLAHALADYEAAIDDITSRHIVPEAVARTADPVRDVLDDLFAGRVGPRPSKAELQGLEKMAAERVEQKIPPGYKDANKPDEKSAGDYIIWAQILQHAKEASDQAPFLFVTKEEKLDWFEKRGEEIVGPRRELLREFADTHERGYQQVTLQRFLELAKEHLGVSVAADTIERAAPGRPDVVWSDDAPLNDDQVLRVNLRDAGGFADSFNRMDGFNAAVGTNFAGAAISKKWRQLNESLAANLVGSLSDSEALRRLSEASSANLAGSAPNREAMARLLRQIASQADEAATDADVDSSTSGQSHEADPQES